jgi:hypothetical protein
MRRLHWWPTGPCNGFGATLQTLNHFGITSSSHSPAVIMLFITSISCNVTQILSVTVVSASSRDKKPSCALICLAYTSKVNSPFRARVRYYCTRCSASHREHAACAAKPWHRCTRTRPTAIRSSAHCQGSTPDEAYSWCNKVIQIYSWMQAWLRVFHTPSHAQT